MKLLYTLLGLHAIFGTRTGASLFALVGSVTVVSMLASNSLTATTALLVAATAFAVKRAVKR